MSVEVSDLRVTIPPLLMQLTVAYVRPVEHWSILHKPYLNINKP